MTLLSRTLPLVALGAPVVPILLGGIASAHTPWSKISSTVGGLAPLDPGDRFGISVATIGDLDGDGVPDLAVGANNDDDGGPYRGAVHIVLLNADGTVKAQQKISDLAGGFAAPLNDIDFFGTSVAGLGDLDGDGALDIVVGAPGTDDGFGGAGAVYVLFLNTNGTVKAHQKISLTSGGLSANLGPADQFGNSVANIGDFDGDGVTDIAVGAFLDDDGGDERGCVRLLALKPNGTVKAAVKISQTSGNFVGPLADDDRFGVSVTSLGDLDGDGITDIAVGAFLDDTGPHGRHGEGSNLGAVYVLFLDATGKVKAEQKICHATGGFDGVLDEGDNFGIALAGIDDRNLDGIPDLAVGAFGDDDGGLNRGAVWVLSLDQDGTVLGNKKISDLSGKFSGILDNDDAFGRAICELPDLDGDGWDELIVSATYDDDGALNAGALWNLELRARGEGSTVFRNGGGTNPATFQPVTAPEVGNTWQTTIDIVTPGAIASILQIAEGGASQGIFLSGLVNGELLILPPFGSGLLNVAAGSHAIPIPEDFTLVNQTFSTQGATFVPGHIQLTNALDITFGTF